MSATNILLIDDHALFRTGLSLVLYAGIADVHVIEAASLEEARHSNVPVPNVILLDIQLPGLNGLECIELLQRTWPQAPIIMLSSDGAPATVHLALQRGASAFVSKSETANAMLAVIERVMRQAPGERGPQVATDRVSGRPRLTPRQCEVLELLCQGLPNKSIGKRLGLSENTVRGHVQALLALLNVSSRTEASYAARRSGLID